MAQYRISIHAVRILWRAIDHASSVRAVQGMNQGNCRGTGLIEIRPQCSL